MIALSFKGDLEGVTDFWFDDNVVNPYYFTFVVRCSKCREEHPNPVKFQQHEKQDLPNSRGDANLVMKCKFCGNHQNVTVTADPKSKYQIEEVGSAKQVGTFDTRGIELVRFIPDGPFTAKSSSNASKYTVELEDGEWYDYDEAAGHEISITNTEWTISKLK